MCQKGQYLKDVCTILGFLTPHPATPLSANSRNLPYYIITTSAFGDPLPHPMRTSYNLSPLSMGWSIRSSAPSIHIHPTIHNFHVRWRWLAGRWMMLTISDPFNGFFFAVVKLTGGDTDRELLCYIEEYRVPRLRESCLLTPTGHRAAVHATWPLICPAL